ncbi:MAG: alcohol dehydrogenase catalytic domain-containing protein [Nevskia sp.]|nr:alcohol dehydrogenase catalytic domain-containing protein [Nevskia sp.]
MKAAVFRGVGKPLSIETIPTPKAGPGELVLRVHHCGICGSDLHATQEGTFLVPDGTVLGHEFAGEIVETGAPGWKVGEMVTAVPVYSCVDCAALGECKDGLGILCPRVRIVGLHVDVPGAYAEYVKVSAREAMRLPAQVKTREGATTEPLAVGLHAVRSGKVGIGDRVLVLGAGPIGLAVAIFARICGARNVVVSEYAPARREAAGRLGATAVIDPAREDVGAAFRQHAGAPPDVIFESVGIPGMIQKCVEMAGVHTRVVVVGVCMHEDRFAPMIANFKEISIQFVMGYGRPDWRVVLDLLDSGRVDPRALITDEVSLAQLPAAFEGLRKPSTQIKILVRPGLDSAAG